MARAIQEPSAFRKIALSAVRSNLTRNESRLYGILTTLGYGRRMFEGKILPASLHDQAGHDASTEEGVRALSWNELVGRLGAARDFRRLMGGGSQNGTGSFDASCASHLAALDGGTPGINPFDLADRKMANCMDFGTHEVGSDRGR